jgi:hypothetical protein
LAARAPWETKLLKTSHEFVADRTNEVPFFIIGEMLQTASAASSGVELGWRRRPVLHAE